MSHFDTARKLVLGDRNADYGSPRGDFEGTALGWTALLREKLAPGFALTAEDVARMMVFLKLNRDAHKAKDDNKVDAHGYLLCLEWLETGRKPE